MLLDKPVKKRPSLAGVFITDEIRKTMRDRDKQKKRYYRSRNLLEWEKYRVLRNKVVSMRRKAVQDHFKTLCKEKYADQRKFWNTIRPYINSRKKKNNSRIVLKENDQIMREPREDAETFEDDLSLSCELSISSSSSSKFPMTTSFIAIDGGTAAKHNGTL